MSTTLHRRRGRDLVPAELFDRLVQRVTVDGRIPPGIAERVTDQVLAFLSASATTSRVFLRPSRTIDAGWHAGRRCGAHHGSHAQRRARRRPRMVDGHRRLR